MSNFVSDLCRNGAAKLTVAAGGDGHKIYVCIGGLNYVFRDGEYQGFYNPEGPGEGHGA